MGATRCGTSPTVCNGGSSAWTCCTSSNRCAVGGGDCDRDTDCQPGLKCGTNNCRSFHPGAQPAADCCIRSTEPVAGTCNGDSRAWNCCSTSNRCKLREGDCDNDSECQSGLVCASNNCRQFHPGAHSLADCCIRRFFGDVDAAIDRADNSGEPSDDEDASERTDNSGEPSEDDDVTIDRTDNSGELSDDSETEEKSLEADFKDPAESKEAEDANWGPDDVDEPSEDE